ncbi:hypothetical protein T459_12628 [Capsicum annuum]|uniref:Uncharacterized protein n=1 Tax=Capsicum annuum TaxID=4072 RepID=A0A2G2ZQF2_CAPAN|nr:hypothetical protein T459_12628 [Capsicum annuum]
MEVEKWEDESEETKELMVDPAEFLTMIGQKLETDENRSILPHVSVRTMNGIHDFRTIRVTASVKEKVVHLLIDTESTHYFLDLNTARRFGCMLTTISPFEMFVADGKKLQSNYFYRKLAWKMQGMTFDSDMLMLPIGGCKMVLGIQWLISLGDIMWNFKKLKMEFSIKGHKISLRGIQSTKTKIIQLNNIEKLLAQPSELCMISLGVMVDETTVSLCSMEISKNADEEADLQVVLQNYKDLFEVHTELPPRLHDHKILLKDGTRYPTIQKDEIEKIVNEMLNSGVISSNTSPYSSPFVMLTPYEVVYGQKPSPLLPYMAFDSHIDAVDRSLQSKEATIRVLKANLSKAQSRMKTIVDGRRTDKNYSIEDWVVGKVAYILGLPATSKIHPTFHISWLKKKLGSNTASVILPVVQTESGPVLRVPEAILDIRLAPKNGQAIAQALIKWMNATDEDSTWEDLEFVRADHVSYTWSEQLLRLLGSVKARKGTFSNGTIEAATQLPQVILTTSAFDKISGIVLLSHEHILSHESLENRPLLTFSLKQLLLCPHIGNFLATMNNNVPSAILAEDETQLSRIRLKTNLKMERKLRQSQPSELTSLFPNQCVILSKSCIPSEAAFRISALYQDLADSYEPPFKSCVEQGKASSVMCAYNLVNGIPNCANFDLSTTIARGQWGLPRLHRDCDAVATMCFNEGYAKESEDAVAATLKAGMDVNCGSHFKKYGKSALEKQKVVQESDID